jgi:hypothetical protein
VEEEARRRRASRKNDLILGQSAAKARASPTMANLTLTYVFFYSYSEGAAPSRKLEKGGDSLSAADDWSRDHRCTSPSLKRLDGWRRGHGGSRDAVDGDDVHCAIPLEPKPKGMLP